MSNILASKKVAGGIIVQKRCRSCQHAFWTSGVNNRSECVDCDPPEVLAEDQRSVGRNLDHKQSDHQYHGCYQE